MSLLAPNTLRERDCILAKRLMSVGLFALGLLLIGRGTIMLSGMTTGVALAFSPAPVTPFVDTACLDCHTDRQRLTELAVVPEVAEAEESLSSGPG
jgi:hypothetical protein